MPRRWPRRCRRERSRPGHVDALTRATKNLDPGDRQGLLGLDPTLAATAANSTVAEFDKYVKAKAKSLDRRDGEERLDGQRRSARLRHWFDDDGMWNLRGRLAPDTGKDLARLIDSGTDDLRRGELPASAPSDPVQRDQHLRALAFTELLLSDRSIDPAAATTSAGSTGTSTGTGPKGSSGQAGRRRPGPPLVVVDATQTDGAGGPVVDWGYPVELPASILRDVLGAADPDVVIVANGLVLHAPGRLDLGRTTRLANRAQRRALAGLYSTCAVPGCDVHYDRCRLHHVVWWRDGGRTDLDNLLPICQHHHTRLHEDGWNVTLGPNRELTIEVPDGNVLRTGPPRRCAAARGSDDDHDGEHPPTRPNHPRAPTSYRHETSAMCPDSSLLEAPKSGGHQTRATCPDSSPLGDLVTR